MEYWPDSWLFLLLKADNLVPISQFILLFFASLSPLKSGLFPVCKIYYLFQNKNHCFFPDFVIVSLVSMFFIPVPAGIGYKQDDNVLSYFFEFTTKYLSSHIYEKCFSLI